MRAKAGVGTIIHNNHTEECQYISERIITVKINIDYHKLNSISVYKKPFMNNYKKLVLWKCNSNR